MPSVWRSPPGRLSLPDEGHIDADQIIYMASGMCSRCVVNIAIICAAILSYRDDDPRCTPSDDLRDLAKMLEDSPPTTDWVPMAMAKITTAHHRIGLGIRPFDEPEDQ